MIENFPVSDLGEKTESPKITPLNWKLQLSDGREIFLTRIQQHQTYGGMLCGLPMEPERVASRAVFEANEWDGNFHGAPVVIPATIVCGIRSAPKGYASAGSMEWSMLPPITTFAIFKSATTVRDEDEVYSSALIICWQAQFGLPEEQDLLNRLHSIQWVEHAKDWTP